MKHFKLWILVLVGLNIGVTSVSRAQNPWNRRVILQGFWWDFKNDSFPLGWANYLALLGPRLAEAGIEAVYIPVSLKNQSPGSGYIPFDHYDLGDKFQKDYLKTSLGDKNELLRMYASLKANSMYIYQDVVWNHINGAGSSLSSGGQDPEAPEDNSTNRYKNFRYSCYSTPATNEGSKEYLSREGRFPKNWQNFYPNNVSSCCTNPINTPFWGPDIDYSVGAYGKSSNAIYNPNQAPSYMRNNMREWMIWYKKQTGFDGIRIDAVKHFPTEVTEDFLWNLRYKAGWASGGEDFFAFSEWVDFDKNVLDNFCNTVQNRSGTFDFSLRHGIQQMVTSLGNFDLGSLVNYQQNNRYMTVPFVNNHDTYRPIYDKQGKDSAWRTSSELAPHIYKDEPRWALAHAMILAVDGSPLIYFDDLFDIGKSGKRFNHNPTDTASLRINDDLLNLLWCHNNLKFKEGEYLVRNQANDLLIIERKAKAIIAMNDHWDQWQDPKAVQTAFTDGTILIDYTGSAGTSERMVYGGGKVDLAVPPCNGSARRRGYSIWAPKGITGNKTTYNLPIKQEWEMANDLGDRHPLSLEQGGALPPHSTQCRIAGSFYGAAGIRAKIEVHGDQPQQAMLFSLYDNDCQLVDSFSGFGPFHYTFYLKKDGWYHVKLNHIYPEDSFQNLKVLFEYNAPQRINPNDKAKVCSCLNGEDPDLGDEKPFHLPLNLYPNPGQDKVSVQLPNTYNHSSEYHISVTNLNGNILPIIFERGEDGLIQLSTQNLPDGVYLIQVYDGMTGYRGKMIIIH